MILNSVIGGTNTKDATIVPHDVGKDKVAYGSDGKIVGTSPFIFDKEEEITLPYHDQWYSVTFGNNRFVTVASNSTHAAYSDDGITWTQIALPSSAFWNTATFGNGRFISTAYGSNISAYYDFNKELILE